MPDRTPDPVSTRGGGEADRRPLALLVDDEPSILRLLTGMLRPHLRTLVAADLAEARALLAANPVEIVVSDHRLPDGLGLDFLTDLHRQKPEIVGVLMTGYSEEGLAIAAVNSGAIFRYLKKPFAAALVVQTVQDACHRLAQDAQIREATRREGLRGLYGPGAERTQAILHLAATALSGFAIFVAGALVLGLAAFAILYLFKAGLNVDLLDDVHLEDVIREIIDRE
jgi:DNA-binding NtrC family response regulator